jgi:hypothetical protein
VPPAVGSVMTPPSRLVFFWGRFETVERVNDVEEC